MPFSPQTERRLVRLMLARLALTLVGFVIALGLDGLGARPGLGEAARRGLYWTLAFAFAATALGGLCLRRVRHPRRFAAFQLGVDVVIVTALVFFSGGHASVFSFLYVAIAASGALMLERRGAMAAAAASAVAYGGVLLAEQTVWVEGLVQDGPPAHGAVALATWGVHVGAFLLVGALGSVLTGELQRTGAALDRSAHDLRRLRNLNSSIVQSLLSGLLTTDSEGRVGSFNPEAVRITGIPACDAIGTLVDDVLPGTWNLLSIPSGTGFEPVRRTRIAYRNQEGRGLFLGLAGSVLRDAQGAAVGYVVIFQDVTDVVEMEAELRKRERLAAVGEMAAKIAHEIRNPLAAISGSVQMLRDDARNAGSDLRAGAAGEPEKLMNIVVREADRLSGLITDFLDYARPRPIRNECVRVDELVDELVDVMGVSCPENVELVSDVEDSLELEADPDQLRQLLWNLCVNGLQAMPQGGVLTLRGRMSKKGSQAPGSTGRSEEAASCASECHVVEISVEDTGVGIESALVEHLFEPFFTTKTGGTGLGLAMVHRIVEAHGGELELETEPGSGTCFRVRLPGPKVRE